VAAVNTYIRYEYSVYVDSFVIPVASFTKNTRHPIPAVHMYIAKLQILWKSAHHIEKLGSFVVTEETFWVAHSNFRYTQIYTFNRGKVDGTGSYAKTALCIYGEFSMFNISQKSSSMVLW